MATQKIAAESNQIDAEMYDLSKFPELKEKYQIMAVPCLIVDNGHHNGTDYYAIREKQAELLQKVRQFCFIILLIFTETVLCDIEEV